MAKLRRNPRRATGALLINPRRRRHAARRRRHNAAPGVLAVNVRKYRRSGKHGHKVSAYSRSKARRGKRRGKARVRKNPLRLINPRRHRKHARKGHAKRHTSSRRRRNPRHVKFVARRNPRRKSSGRARRGSIMVPGVAGIQKTVGKVPVVGPMLASLVGFVPTSAFGALSVEPTLAVAQLLARYVPALPTNFLYPLSGAILGAATDAYIGPMIGLKKETSRQLAVAMAAAGGGVGYYLWRTGRSTTAGAEMGTLLLSGYGSPIAGAIMGDLGDLYVQAPEYGALLMQTPGMHGADSFGGYGPMTVSPLSSMSPGATL